jgi:hypothetical protein
MESPLRELLDGISREVRFVKGFNLDRRNLSGRKGVWREGCSLLMLNLENRISIRFSLETPVT